MVAPPPFPSQIYLEDFVDRVQAIEVVSMHLITGTSCKNHRCVLGCSSLGIKHRCLVYSSYFTNRHGVCCAYVADVATYNSPRHIHLRCNSVGLCPHTLFVTVNASCTSTQVNVKINAGVRKDHGTHHVQESTTK